MLQHSTSTAPTLPQHCTNFLSLFQRTCSVAIPVTKRRSLSRPRATAPIKANVSGRKRTNTYANALRATLGTDAPSPPWQLIQNVRKDFENLKWQKSGLMEVKKKEIEWMDELRLGGTSGGAGSYAGSGATLPVRGIDIPLPGTNLEVAGSRNSEFWSFFLNT